jgi:hypothetical protein
MLSKLAELRERLAHGREMLESTLGVGKANFLWDAKSRDTVLTHLLRWAEETPHAPFIWWRGEWTEVGDFDQPRATGCRARTRGQGRKLLGSRL